MRLSLVFVFLYHIIPTLVAQSGAAPGVTEVTQEVKELFQLNRYDKAVAILERATADHPSDVSLLGLLGTAYLCSASGVDGVRNVAKARTTMEKAIDAGGEAVFLVSKAKPLGKLTRGASILAATPGELRIGRETLTFVPTRDEPKSGPFREADLKECGLNSSYGKDSNAFHIKTAKETLDFRPLHFSKDESNLACSIAAKYLSLKHAK